MICGHLADIDDYLHQKAELQGFARKMAAAEGFPECRVDVNMADHPASGDIYLTVTGTSAEAGDDGEVGRGNRVNGLITPCRPMTLEAAAGKNPVSHIGKIYNVLSRQIAESVVSEIKDIAYAECLIVGQIGAPVDCPATVAVSILPQNGRRVPELRNQIEAVATDWFAHIPALADALVSGAIELF